MDSRKFDDRWFALQVKTRFEAICARVLRSKGYEKFVPVCKFVSRRSDTRSLTQPKALFPGYVFCRFNHDAKGLIVTTPGVIRIVGYGKMPCPISEDEIENIRLVIRSEYAAVSWPYVTAGQRLRITKGPLRGVTGTLIRVKNDDRLIISVDLLQRSAAVDVDAECVATADPVGGNVR